MTVPSASSARPSFDRRHPGHPSRHRAWLRLLWSLGLATPLVCPLPGCESSSPAKPDPQDAPAELTMDEAARNTAELLALRRRPPAPRTPAGPEDETPPATRRSTVAIERRSPADEASAPDTATGAASAPGSLVATSGDPLVSPTSAPPRPPAPPTPAERQSALVAELLQVLQERGQDESQRARAAALIAILSSLDPEGAGAASSGLRTHLAPPQQDILSVLDELARDLPQAAERDPRDLARLLDRVAARLAAQQAGLDIPRIELCSRVESFGRFTPLPSRAFRAGQSHALLLYSEVANFASVPKTDAADDEAWITSLAQSVTIYRGTTQVAHIPEQQVREISRSPRRDFYLVQRLTLPSTLGTGDYTIKVITRDLGRQGQVEKNIPITLEAR